MAVTTSGKDKILRWTRLFYGGYDLSGDARTIGSITNTIGRGNVHGWSESIVTYLSDGRREVGVTGFQAILNDATGRSFAQLRDPAVSSRLLICFGGGGEPTYGDPAFLLPSMLMSSPLSVDGNVWMINTDFEVDASQTTTNLDNPAGVTLRGATSLSASLTVSSSTSFDFGAASANGWSAVIQVLATSSGNFAMTIKHSTDDSSFATLGTFTTTGGSIGSEFLSGSGTVNRYVGFDAQRTAGTITVAVGFARNL